MTILPKKKNSQAKNDGENVDNGNVVVGNQAPETRDRRGRTSPPRWTNAREEKRGPFHPQSTNSYEEYESIVDVGGGSGGSTSGNPNGAPVQHKRRHRASPHRNVRKHREHRTNANLVNSASVVGGPLMPPAPSTSSAQNLVSNGGNSPNAGTSHGKPADNIAEDYSGYNSGDEYCQTPAWNEEEWLEKERIFEKKMRKKGLIIKKMCEDGACLFRAVADQIYGDQEMHGSVRKLCLDYMAKNADYFSQYVTEDFDTYVKRKRMNHIHGNHVEMQALCEIYNRSLEVFHYSTDPINTFHGIHKTDNEPIRISYHKSIHYNSIVDPYKATVGVGLGLPGYKPGLADKNLMGDAVRQSEEFHIEQAMLEDKLKATDWEATNEVIEEQVARESYLQWLRDNERRNRKASTRSATATCSSSAGGASPDVRCSPTGSRSPRGRITPPASNSPAREGSSLESGACAASLPLDPEVKPPSPTAVADDGGFRLLETASFINQLPPDFFGLTEWEDANIMAQVLAASQQEYLDSLKRSAGSTSSDGAVAFDANRHEAGPSSASHYAHHTGEQLKLSYTDSDSDIKSIGTIETSQSMDS